MLVLEKHTLHLGDHRSICLLFLNNSEHNLEDDRVLRNPLRPDAGLSELSSLWVLVKGRVNLLPEGDRCLPAQPVAACGNTGQVPSNLLMFIEELGAKFLY